MNQVLAAGPWAAVRRRFWRRPGALAGVMVLAAIVLACFAGPLLLPHDGASLDFDHIAAPPSLASGHWFGTDSVGRDLLARTLEGGRLSLLLALAATAVSVVIGVTWGAVAGFFGGRLDAVMMRAVDVLYALPFLILVIVLMVAFGRHPVLLFVAVGAISWLDMARIVRGQALALRQRDYVDAARIAGLAPLQILRRHIVPHLLGIVAVYATLTVPQVILMESFLSFLGLGVPEPQASWGLLVSEGAADMEAAPWALAFPAAFLAATLLCCNLLGDALRDALEPESSP